MKRLFIVALSCVIAFTSRPVLAVPMTMDTTIILDNFTGTFTTPISSHTIAPTNTVGATWTMPSGAMQITSTGDSVQNVGGGAYGWGILDSSHADGTLSVVVNISVATEVYLVFRYTDLSNWWALSWNGTDNSVHCYKVTAGMATEPFGSTTKTFATATNYTLQVVLNGSSIATTIDGGSSLSGTDSFQSTATKHGILGGTVTLASVFDDWTMTITGGTTSFVPAIINAPIRCCEMFPRRLTESK